jgi:hypothetical protein
MNRRQMLVGTGGALAASGVAALLVQRDMGSMAEYDAFVAASRAALTANPRLQGLVRYATLAPNGHNAQPWRFRVGADRIDILPDFSRRTPAVDPDDHHLFVSLGCALENLALAATASGRPGEATFNQHSGSIGFRLGHGSPGSSVLCDAIRVRQSTRGEYDGRPLAGADLNLLVAAATVPGVDMVLVTDRPTMDRVRDLVVSGTVAQMGDTAFLRELKHWVRFNPADAIRKGDGLFTAASGSPTLPPWAGPFLFDRLVSARSESDRYARQLRASSGIAVFAGERGDPEHWVGVGRACQRFALQGTALGLKCAFINQPVEVPSLRAELAALIGTPGRRPDIVMRFGRAPALPYSARRSPSAVII